ncbi:MAG: ribonuclease HI [Alphaproteobacteria bacterium]|nr:ribonuclease HI [Alphaproteobacteria bacterium]
MRKIEIYTDGACSGNPGPGGWAAIILTDASPEELYGGEESTTNNRMEMTAIIKALGQIPDTQHLTLYTDSSYVKDGITSWIKGWKKNGWKTSQRKSVKNQDLWQALDHETTRLAVDWRWVKGHAGNKWNERADSLARQGLLGATVE